MNRKIFLLNSMRGTMKGTALFLVVALLATCDVGWSVEFDQGVYSGLVVAVHQDTARPDDIQQTVALVKEFLEAGSRGIHFAADGGASFGGDVTLVVPRSWNISESEDLASAQPEMSIRSADILLHETLGPIPDTLQVEQCGVPGRQIRVPMTFLDPTPEDETKYGSSGKILAHEWGHFRFGAQDEHGYGGDPVYSSVYGDSGATSCTPNQLPGDWYRDCAYTNQPIYCTPGSEGCYYCIRETATIANVHASLGYLPALSHGKFCTKSTHNSDTPSPQNILCGKLSVQELIDMHPDTGSMTPHSPAGINIVVKEEALPRVMILLNACNAGQQETLLDYTTLLTEIRSPLTSYKNLLVGMASYRATGTDTVELFNKVDFATGNYDLLMSKIPVAEDCPAIPDLGQVLRAVPLDGYSAGTMLVMPVTDPLVAAAKLDTIIANELHKSRVKPLFLYPEAEPDLSPAGSFLQTSGTRFIHRNDTDGPVDYASGMAQYELDAFVNNNFMNDHPIVHREKLWITKNAVYKKTLLYQQDVAEHLIAVVTSSRPVSELKLLLNKYGVLKDCREDNLCTYQDNNIFFKQTFNSFPSPGEEWTLVVQNNGGQDAEVTIVRSEVNFIGVTEELDVQIWSSEGRAPIASIRENSQLVLYASVMNYGYQVLSSRITVHADVTVMRPGGGNLPDQHRKLEFFDNGLGADMRKDDSVYSLSLAAVAPDLEVGSVITVSAVYVNSYGSIGGDEGFRANGATSETSGSRARVAGGRRSSGALSSSGLFTMDPGQTECCGSFVQSPHTDSTHRINGFNVYLWDLFDPIVTTRAIHTSASTTPAPTSTAPTTPAPTTTAPAPTTTAPASTTTAPAPTTTAAVPTTTAAVPTTTAPAPTTTAPAPTTTAAVPTTTASAPTTTAPVPTTTAPAPTTAAPAPNVELDLILLMKMKLTIND